MRSIHPCECIYFICIIFLCIAPEIFAQPKNLKFDHLDIDDGLSQNLVYSIVQDQKGYMWFGTADGLNKYDGYKFTVYNHDSNDTSTIAANSVTVIFEDRNGHLWVGAGGLNLFDRNSEKFRRYSFRDSFTNSIRYDKVTAISEDKQGNKWIGTADNGLWSLHFKGKHSIQEKKQLSRLSQLNADVFFNTPIFKPETSLGISDKRILSLLNDSAGNLWVGTNNGVYKLIPEKNTEADTTEKSAPLEKPNLKMFRHFFKDKEILSLCEDSQGRIWAGTISGVYKFVNESDENPVYIKLAIFENPDLFPVFWMKKVNFIREVNEDKLWLGSFGALIIFDPNQESYEYTRHLSNVPGSLSHNNILTIYQDRSGIIWLGNAGRGVDKFLPETKKFRNYANREHNREEKSVYALFEDTNNVLWFSSELNVYCLNQLTGDIKLVNFDDKYVAGVQDFMQDRSGLMWFAKGHRLYGYDPEKKLWTVYEYNPGSPNSLPENTILKIYKGEEANIWLATTETLSSLDTEEKTFTHLPLPIDKEDIINCAYQDSFENFWLSTNTQLLKFNPRKNTWKKFNNDSQKASGIDFSNIISFQSDPRLPDRFLWIGTDGNGLFCLDQETNEYIQYTSIDGLPNNVIYGILSDKSNQLWLSTNKGLSRFDPETEEFRNFSITDGISGNEFNRSSYFKNAEGKMFFGGINGITAFFPEQIEDNDYIPPLAITDFQLFYQSVSIDDSFSPLKKAISESEELILSHKQNHIAFNFAALNFINPEKNKYAFRLDNFDKKWNYVGSARRAIYTNLHHGEYRFHVKGSNNDGIWNEQGTSLKILIKPPFWKTWWAYMIYIVLISVLILLLRLDYLRRHRLRENLRLERLEREKLKEIDQLKSHFFTGISHEFRTPLTLIQGPVEDLLKTLSDDREIAKLRLIKNSSSKLLSLVNQLLDLSRIEAGKMPLEMSRGNIVEFLERITFTFLSLAEQREIKIHFLAKEAKINFSFDPGHFEKILNNLLSNAFKFTPSGGRITVSVATVNRRKVQQQTNINTRQDKPQVLEGGTGDAENFLKLTVSDTGKGIPKAAQNYIFDRFYQVSDSSDHPQGTGVGLALVKELVASHHGQIRVESVPGQGTTFVLLFPVKEYLFLEDEEMVCQEAAVSLNGGIDGLKTLNGKDDIRFEGKNSDLIVLVIEDHAVLRKYIRGCLEKDYEIVEAENGAEGIRKAMEIIPDLVVSDVMMPEKNGYEVCETLKSDRKTSHIPVILLTAKATQADKITGLKTGADDYLVKPFDSSELLVRIKNLIDIRLKLQNLFAEKGFIKPEKFAISSLDEAFLKKVLKNIDENIDDESFGVESLAELTGLSSSQLYRKLRALTNLSTANFINNVRLEHAANMLKQRAFTIAEIAYRVGFSSPSYFTHCFHKKFGYTPGDYMKKEV